ncbi:hydantoinase/oxoprolinase family protein [Roseimaritima ulvae]|uniref:Hydantoinase/oxoprolinase n=1 Tax=Roseimaritima ulvae TaxID=980254 RepID=A0A5B9QM25_9BACT|nr:hydantoinase/oxoprolinase family protein [Roseimaritima ulvae]QEG40098.1 Hydantoinase/oxoprolinase [Roseimaritima ulvae]
MSESVSVARGDDDGDGQSPYVVGLDIGGANLKLADTRGVARDEPFPLWKSPQRLTARLRELLGECSADAPLAVTMTGELADCFDDAAHGVRFIAEAVLAAAPQSASIVFYGVDGRFANLAEVRHDPDRFAASNWHALAYYLAAQLVPDALLIDIGSTTCDIIPLQSGRVGTDSKSDFDRLVAGELLYLGIGRTPVCAVVDHLTFEGRNVPVMNELFATTGDCALMLGIEAEDFLDTDTDTADGKPRSRTAATARLARMIGLDRRRFTEQHAVGCSRQVLQAVQQRVAAAVAAAPTQQTWILSGHGQALLSDTAPAGVEVIDLRERLGESLSRVAPAYAVAQLQAQAWPL